LLLLSLSSSGFSFDFCGSALDDIDFLSAGFCDLPTLVVLAFFVGLFLSGFRELAEADTQLLDLNDSIPFVAADGRMVLNLEFFLL